MSTLESRQSSRVWAVGVVRTGREDSVSELLRKNGCDVWFPIYERWVEKSGVMQIRQRPEIIAMPCIKGYVFIRRDSLPVVVDLLYWLIDFHMLLLRPDGKIALLSEADMDWLRGMESKAARSVRQRHLEAPWKPGQWVMVPDGPWRGYRGPVKAVNGLMVTIEGGDFSFQIDIPAEMLQSCPIDEQNQHAIIVNA